MTKMKNQVSKRFQGESAALWSVMFWGCLIWGVGTLGPVEGHISSRELLQVLDEHLWQVFIKLPYYNANIFQVDNAPISPRIILVPRVPDQYFWLIGRISAKQSGTYGQSRTITWWRYRLSPTRVGYRKSDRLLFLNMFKNSSRSKTVGCWSSWSSEGPLKVALSRLPSGAFVYPLELSSALGSFRIPSAALCRGSCEECHKESIVT